MRHVLVKDDLLAPLHTDLDAYVEFVAVALELKHFAATERPYYFPAIRDWPAIDALAARDVADVMLYRSTRPADAPDFLEPLSELPDEADEPQPQEGVIDLSSSPRCVRLMSQADRAARVGNHVRAAILRMRAARLAYPERVREAVGRAQDDLRELAARLQAMWELSDEEAEQWAGHYAAAGAGRRRLPPERSPTAL